VVQPALFLLPVVVGPMPTSTAVFVLASMRVMLMLRHVNDLLE
jgi:hypothetical protein